MPDNFTNRANDYFLGRGYPAHAAAALAGNASWESGGNTQAVHDKGTGFGLYGWRDPQPGAGRRTDLFNWARTAGPGGTPLDPSDELTQFKFAHHELTGPEKAAGDALRSSTNLADAQNAAMAYLRPQGYTADSPASGHGYAQRYNLAAPLVGADPMPVPIGGPGAGGAGVMAPTPPPVDGGLLAPPDPYMTPPAGQSIDQEIAGWSKYGQPDADKMFQMAGAATKTGLGLLGQSRGVADFGGGQAQVYRPQPTSMPNFTQMLAQQRLARRM
jgi:hypothetical protein